MFIFWWLLGNDAPSEEQEKKDSDKEFKEWITWYKSLSVKQRKWQDRKDSIIVYGLGALLILSIIGSLVAASILIYNNLK